MSRADALAILGEVRSQCPAIREVLVPEQIWNEYQAFTLASDDALHHPLMVGAAMTATIARLTAPVHRFHVDSQQKFKKAFRNSLADSWWKAPNIARRHARSRRLQSNFAELLVAFDLVEARWAVSALDAWQDGIDIVTVDTDGASNGVEVKFIGTSDELFRSICESLQQKDAGGHWEDLPAARNYLVSRIYEAAHQLKGSAPAGRRVACMVVDQMSWEPFAFSLNVKPQFLAVPVIEHVEHGTWPVHDAKLRDRYAGYPDNVGSTIQELDDVWVLTQNSYFQLQCRWQRGSSCPIQPPGGDSKPRYKLTLAFHSALRRFDIIRKLFDRRV